MGNGKLYICQRLIYLPMKIEDKEVGAEEGESETEDAE